MNEQPYLPTPIPSAELEQKLDILQLGKAVRFALVCIVCGFSMYAMYAVESVPRQFGIFKDMLGEGPGSELPALSTFVYEWKMLFWAIGVGIPVVCVLQLFSRRIVRSIYIVGIAGAVATAEAVFLNVAMALPMIEIIKRLNGP